MARGGDETTAGIVVVSFLWVRAGQSWPSKTCVVSGMHNDQWRAEDTHADNIPMHVRRSADAEMIL